MYYGKWIEKLDVLAQCTFVHLFLTKIHKYEDRKLHVITWVALFDQSTEDYKESHQLQQVKHLLKE